jgi:hypothetical protein
MINYYQPWLLPFLSVKKKRVPIGVKRYYYHSFEDALWDLLLKKQIKKGSILLFPNFYCQDVLNNVKAHGYKYVLYPLDPHFQVSPKTFRKYVKTYKPAVVFIFHACGITLRLITDLSRDNYLSQDTTIIEDCVHRLVNPKKVTLLGDNHYIIDSLRKVSPLPGSCLYGTAQSLSFPQTSNSSISEYVISSSLYYLWFRFALTISAVANVPSLASWAHTYVLKKHDDIIGDSRVPYSGFPLILHIFDRFNFNKVEKLKTKQVKLYERYLNPIFNKKPFYKVCVSKEDYGKLHVYPLGYSIKPDIQLERYLHKKGVVVWFKFPDSKWSENGGVLFLPLGFHITERNIKYIGKTFQNL